MTNGLAYKCRGDWRAVDIHYNGTGCSGYSQKGCAIHNLLERWIKRPEDWCVSLRDKYSSDYEVIAPMLMIGWEDE